MDELLKRFNFSIPKSMRGEHIPTKTSDQPRVKLQDLAVGTKPNVITAKNVNPVEIEADRNKTKDPGLCKTPILIEKEVIDIGDWVLQLNKEADKVRKWKIAVNIELQQSKLQLNDANSTIDQLRKSVSTLQQKLVEQSLRMKEDLVMQEDVAFKAASTWDMYSNIRKQMISLDEGILRCNDAKNEISEWQIEKLQLVDKLVIQFENLKCTHVNVTEHFKANVAELETEGVDMQKYIQNKITEYDNTIEDVKDQLEAELEKGVYLKDELKMTQNEISSLKDDIVNLESDVSSKSNNMRQLEENIEEKDNVIQTLEKRNVELNKNNLRQKKKISKLLKEVDELSILMVTINEMKVEYDNLNADFGKLREKNECLSFAKVCAKNDLADERQRVEEMKNVNAKLSVELKETEGKLEERISELGNSRQRIEELGKEMELLRDVNVSLKEELPRKENIILENAAEKARLSEQISEHARLIETAREEITVLKNKAEESSSENAKSISALEGKLLELETHLQEANEMSEILNCEKDKIQIELENKEKENGKVNCDLEREIELKKNATDEISELKAQLVDMTTQSNASALNYDSQIKEMINTLESYKDNNEKIVAQKQKEIDELKDKLDECNRACAESIAQLKDEILQMTAQLQTANVNLNTVNEEKDEMAKRVEENNKIIDDLNKIQKCQELEITELKIQVLSQGNANSGVKKSILKRNVAKAVTFIKTPSPVTSDNSNSDGIEIAPNVVNELYSQSNLTYSIPISSPLFSSPVAMNTYDSRKLKSNCRLEFNTQAIKKMKRDSSLGTVKKSNLKMKPEKKLNILTINTMEISPEWLEDENLSVSDV